MSTRSKWSLIGIPDHQGVIHVGGRVGAARGPRVFRDMFLRLNGREGVRSALVDEGDVTPVLGQEHLLHRQAADSVRKAHVETGLTVVVGGAHDHGYSHLLGIRDALTTKKRAPRLGCINIDAHLDVRKPDPLITSGSPFYLALEEGVLHPRRFIEFGIQSHCNAPALWEYVESREVKIVPFEKLRHGQALPTFKRCLTQLRASCDAIVVSLDLDAAASAFAPGVSAPQAEGFDPTDILEMMEASGVEKKVVSLGIFELNPEHDIDGRTARLGATAAYHFIARKLSS